jgi:hypothetical protein
MLLLRSSSSSSSSFCFFVMSLFSILMSHSEGAVDIQQMRRYWSDPSYIIDNLDDYEILWIQPHGCVWSECAIDDTDDAYMGDNRDGDERWYFYRTQDFCANAAFSLYGIRKEDQRRGNWRGCTGRHFINSYFTYGGADILLQAAGQVPLVYYDNNNQNADDGVTSNSNNAQCVQVDGSDVTHYQTRQGDGNNNNNNNHNGGHEEEQEYVYMSTMGCSTTATSADTAATFVMARFEAETCNGNKYLDTLDTMESYNAQHDSIGQCHRIWDVQWTNSNNNNNIVSLMKNAWTCDIDLYPNGCPDPFGQKAKYNHALETAARGQNAELSMKSMNAKMPLRRSSVALAVVTLILLLLGYYMKNHKRIINYIHLLRDKRETTTTTTTTTTQTALRNKGELDDDNLDTTNRNGNVCTRGMERCISVVFFIVAYLQCIYIDVRSVIMACWKGLTTGLVTCCEKNGCLRKIGRKRKVVLAFFPKRERKNQHQLHDSDDKNNDHRINNTTSNDHKKRGRIVGTLDGLKLKDGPLVVAVHTTETAFSMDDEFPSNDETASNSNTTATGSRFTSDDINDVFVVPTFDDQDEVTERDSPVVTENSDSDDDTHKTSSYFEENNHVSMVDSYNTDEYYSFTDEYHTTKDMV